MFLSSGEKYQKKVPCSSRCYKNEQGYTVRAKIIPALAILPIRKLGDVLFQLCAELPRALERIWYDVAYREDIGESVYISMINQYNKLYPHSRIILYTF